METHSSGTNDFQFGVIQGPTSGPKRLICNWCHLEIQEEADDSFTM